MKKSGWIERFKSRLAARIKAQSKAQGQDAAGTNGTLQSAVIAGLRQVYDPEIPANIYDLGLIYELHVDQRSGVVLVRMTLTSPACPVAQSFPGIVQRAVEDVEGVSSATVELVWEPQWSPERMSEAARVQLGMV